MRDRSTLGVLWRRRWIVAATFLIFVVVAGVLSKVLPKAYSASSTLIVVQRGNSATFDAVQAAQVTARTYADVVDNPAIARQVADQIGGGLSRASVASEVSVSAVIDTQLLTISAEDRNPRRAALLANTYATDVTQYVSQFLAPTAGAVVTPATRAVTPTAPARPRPALYVLIAAILGLCLGIGAAFLNERLDTRLRTADEFRDRFSDAVILARIPRRGRGVAARAFTESFALLRTTLQFTRAEGPPQVIAVTSAREGEGKTTCVQQMALTSAQVDSHVVVVDADFRRPNLQRQLMPDFVGSLRPGLSECLIGAAPAHEAVHQTGLRNVDLVPTGPLPPNPAAFLESTRLQTTLDDLAKHADMVLVDCPPLSAGADAAIVCGRADGVIVVVDLHQANERTVRELVRQLESVRAPVLGFVLNRDSSAELDYAYYDYSADRPPVSAAS